MGNTVSRSHIRDADRGVAKATRANTRRNSTNVPPPPPPISTPTASTTSSPDDQNLPDTTPPLPENRHAFNFTSDQPDLRPVKRRARHVSAEAAFIEQPPAPLPDPSEPPPGASPAEVHAARTETPPRVDKPPRARKVVSFNENVHVVTYPYEASNHSSAELPAITRYPEPKHGRRRSRSVFRLLSRAPPDHQCLPYEACCGLRIASDAQIVYDDQPASDERLLSFDSSKDLYDNGLVVSYERPYSDAVADDFDYVHRDQHEEEQDDDTFSLSDAHPSCEAIDEPEAIGDQLLSREDSRDSPAFDIAPLWQRLKRVDELDAVSKNTFLRESARRRHARDAKPPRPPRRDAQGISHSRAARAKARRCLEGSSKSDADTSVTNADTATSNQSPAPAASEDDSTEKLPSTASARVGSQASVEDSVKPEPSANTGEALLIKPVTTSPTTPESSKQLESLEPDVPSQPERRVFKEPDPAKERRIPAPARSRATSAGSIQKHMASFTTESAASTERDFMDVPLPPDDRREREDRFVGNPMVATSSAVTVEPKSEKNLSISKEHDIPKPPHTIPGKTRVRSEPHDVSSDIQPLATVIRTSRSARVAGTSQATMDDDPTPGGIKARATVRPAEDPVLPEIEPNGENISHSWARLNDLTRKQETATGLGSKRSFAATLRADLEESIPIQFPDDGNEKDVASTDRESDRTSTMDLDLNPLSLPINDDYGIAPCSPVQGYAPIAGVYYGNSSPSTADPGSPRLGFVETADLMDYPEYEMLNGNVNDHDSLFGSEPNTPRVSNSNWDEPFNETFFELEDELRSGTKPMRGSAQRDRNPRQSVPEVLLHDWSGSTPVEPNVEMVDSAPNSRSSTSHLFAEEHSAKTAKREGGNSGVTNTKRINVDISTLYENAAFKSDVEPSQAKKANGTSSISEKHGSDEKIVSNIRKSRSDRPVGSSIDGKGRGYGRRREAKKMSLSNTEAWISTDYEINSEQRAKSDAHEGRAFCAALPVSFPADPKLHDFQIAVERKAVSEIGYRKNTRTGRGASFVDREVTDERVWEGKEEGQKRVALERREEGTLRGMMGRLVSGMHMAKRLVSQN